MAGADDMLALAASRADELAVGGLGVKPRRRVAVVTCMDARLDLFAMLGLELGDAHIIRNAGGIVTDDVVRSLSVSQRMLDTEEVVVVMHERCGLLGASDDEFRAELATDGATPDWQLGAFEDLDAAARAGLERLRSSPELPHRDRIRGFVFDIDAGTLRDVETAPAG